MTEQPTLDATRPVAAPRHRYIVADLLTDTDLGVIHLAGAQYSRRISAQGDLSGSFTLADSTSCALARLMNSRPVALYAERQLPGQRPELWWGGVVWSCKPSKDRRGAVTAPVSAATFDSLTSHRKLWTDVTYTDQDPLQIFRGLWTHMQTGTGASYGISIGTEVRGTDQQTITYHDHDDAWYADLLSALSAAEAGFEWTIDVSYDGNGQRVRQLRIGDPALGQAGTAHLLTRPGNLLTWSWPGDLTNAGTHFRTRGAAVEKNVGGDVVPIMSTVATDTALVASGYPRLDVSEDHDEPSPVTLDALARTLRDRVGGVQLVPEVTVRLPGSSFTPGNLGDYTRAVIVDPYFPGGRLDATWRAIGITVRPSERGRDEEATIELLPEGENL